MPVRRWLGCVVLVSAAAIAGCRDFTGPSSSAHKKPTSPVGASFTRYILISGVWTCVEECDDDSGPDSKLEGLPTSAPDTSAAIPFDSVAPDPTGSN
jgi:hypothetical protein